MTEIADLIQDLDIPDPRVVADLGSVDFEVEYVRDDVADQYSEEDLDEAYRLVMANQVTGDDFSDLLEGRRYDAQTWFLEDIVVFLFPGDRYRAVFASFDYDGDFPVNELVAEVSAAATE